MSAAKWKAFTSERIDNTYSKHFYYHNYQWNSSSLSWSDTTNLKLLQKIPNKYVEILERFHLKILLFCLFWWILELPINLLILIQKLGTIGWDSCPRSSAPACTAVFVRWNKCSDQDFWFSSCVGFKNEPTPSLF